MASGSKIDCFLLEPSDRQVVSLRRYAGAAPICSESRSYHNAQSEIDRGPYKDEVIADSHGHDDPRWPTSCACGYEFLDVDMWQRNVERLFLRSDSGELVTLHDAPAGAMWYAPWFEDAWKGPDGRCLVVRTPGGDWVSDAPSSDGGHWTRTGVPPLVTATPSIGQKGLQGGGWRYHGWLRNGRLVEC